MVKCFPVLSILPLSCLPLSSPVFSFVFCLLVYFPVSTNSSSPVFVWPFLFCLQFLSYLLYYVLHFLSYHLLPIYFLHVLLFHALSSFCRLLSSLILFCLFPVLSIGPVTFFLLCLPWPFLSFFPHPCSVCPLSCHVSYLRSFFLFPVPSPLYFPFSFFLSCFLCPVSLVMSLLFSFLICSAGLQASLITRQISHY